MFKQSLISHKPQPTNKKLSAEQLQIHQSKKKKTRFNSKYTMCTGPNHIVTDRVQKER